MSRTYSMRARMLKIYMRIVSMGWDGMEKREKERGEKHHSEIEKSNMNVTICMHYFYDWCELNNIKICKNTHRRAEPSQNAFPVTTTQHNTKPSHRTSSHAQEKKEKKKKNIVRFPLSKRWAIQHCSKIHANDLPHAHPTLSLRFTNRIIRGDSSNWLPSQLKLIKVKKY